MPQFLGHETYGAGVNVVSPALSGTPTAPTATTGTQTTQVATTAFVQNTIQADHALCNGRLTLATGDPVNVAGSSGSTLYFTPFGGNTIGLYDGSTTWNLLTFTERSLAISVATGVFDVFAYNNAGTVTLETLAWTNNSTRATSLVFQDGVYVKSGATTRRYLGTLYNNAGTVSDIQSARNLFNYYNRITKLVYNQDPNGTYAYTTVPFNLGPMDSGNAGWKITIVVGVRDSLIDVKVSNLFVVTTGDVRYYLGIGLNTTGTNTANYGVYRMDLLNTAMSLYIGLLSVPPLGYNYYNGLEQMTSGTSGTGYPNQPTSGISAVWPC